jgi:hypothetical protein
MNEYKKPLPAANLWSKNFWEGAKHHKLLLQKCNRCGVINHPPYPFCGECMGEEFVWIQSSGKGKLYTFTVTKMAAPPAFAEDVPYVVAMVDLEEGVRMLTNIVNCDPASLRCDMDVEVAFDNITSEVTLPKFKPVR